MVGVDERGGEEEDIVVGCTLVVVVVVGDGDGRRERERKLGRVTGMSRESRVVTGTRRESRARK